jgi:hypothetical protein
VRPLWRMRLTFPDGRPMISVFHVFASRSRSTRPLAVARQGLLYARRFSVVVFGWSAFAHQVPSAAPAATMCAAGISPFAQICPARNRSSEARVHLLVREDNTRSGAGNAPDLTIRQTVFSDLCRIAATSGHERTICSRNDVLAIGCPFLSSRGRQRFICPLIYKAHVSKLSRESA